MIEGTGSINCTVVELKLPRPASVPSGSSGINCTVVELKLLSLPLFYSGIIVY